MFKNNYLSDAWSWKCIKIKRWAGFHVSIVVIDTIETACVLHAPNLYRFSLSIDAQVYKVSGLEYEKLGRETLILCETD